MMQQRLAWFAFGLSMSGVFVLLTIGAVYLFDRPYLTYTNLPFPVVTQKVSPGDVVPIVVGRCNSDNRTRVYVVGRALVPVDNPTQPTILLSANSATLKPGCGTSVSRLNAVPADTPPGKYRFDGSAEINGLVLTFVMSWQSQPFEVVQ